jgi:hypothetical protein
MARTATRGALPAALNLLAYCENEDWAGHDPYDALNSRLLTVLPWLDARLPRLVLTQALKRSPVNLRRIARVPKTQNPKALALFLSAFLRLPGLGPVRRTQLIEAMTAKLIALRARDQDCWCWGYSFPWQTRTVIVPRGTPNLVCTSFVAGALLDVYEQTSATYYLDMAKSAATYIAKELYWSDGDRASFAYPLPSHRIPIHNANLLAAALLCRVYAHTGKKRFLDVALEVGRYSAGRQRADGAWQYGEHRTLQWIDNFHTGYNLCALKSIGRSAATTEFEAALRRGHDFYRRHFFRADGAARYFHDRTYPIDIHAVAQSIITLVELKDLHHENMRLAHDVFRWAMNHMWDERGFFYYRVLRACTIRTSYMRWSQAWMLLALAVLLDEPASSLAQAPHADSDRRPRIREELSCR